MDRSADWQQEDRRLALATANTLRHLADELARASLPEPLDPALEQAIEEFFAALTAWWAHLPANGPLPRMPT